MQVEYQAFVSSFCIMYFMNFYRFLMQTSAFYLVSTMLLWEL